MAKIKVNLRRGGIYTSAKPLMSSPSSLHQSRTLFDLNVHCKVLSLYARVGWLRIWSPCAFIPQARILTLADNSNFRCVSTQQEERLSFSQELSPIKFLPYFGEIGLTKAANVGPESIPNQPQIHAICSNQYRWARARSSDDGKTAVPSSPLWQRYG